MAANSYLRAPAAEQQGLEVIFPSMKLCTDNGAMVAGLAWHLLHSGRRDGLDLNAEARVPMFRRAYP